MRYYQDSYGRVYVDRGMGAGFAATVNPSFGPAVSAELIERPSPIPTEGCCLSATGLCYCSTGNQSIMSPGACGPNAPRCGGAPGPLLSATAASVATDTGGSLESPEFNSAFNPQCPVGYFYVLLKSGDGKRTLEDGCCRIVTPHDASGRVTLECLTPPARTK